MPDNSTPKVEDITRYVAKHPRFSTADINQEFHLGTRNTAAYLAMMRRRGQIKPGSPAKIEGVSQWVFTGKLTEAMVQEALLQFLEKTGEYPSARTPGQPDRLGGRTWAATDRWLREEKKGSLRQIIAKVANNEDPQKSQFVALAAELGSKFVESVLEQVRAVEAAQDHLSKLAHT